VAEASIVNKTVTRVQLDLSVDEAETLYTMCAFVSGDSSTSPRKHTDSLVGEFLDALGYDYTQTDAYAKIRPGSNLDFSDTTSRFV
jgi:hypothetical protein